MAYATATVNTTGEILAALATFLTADGWTINRNTTGANRTGSILQVTSGQCAFAIANETYTHNHWPNYVFSTTARDRFKMAIATSISAGVTTYWGHTGSLVTSDADADRVLCNLMDGPFTYYFMSKGNVADRYCHVIIQMANEIFAHFSFGNIDKREFTHSGAAYCTSQVQLYYPDNTAPNTCNHDRPNYTNVPFASNQWGGANRSAILLYAPNALPGGWAQHRVGTEACLRHHALVDDTGPTASSLTNAHSVLNVRAVYDGPLPFSGVTPLFPLPVIPTNSASNQACWIGEFPDVRQLNMTGMTAGQEITVGTDIWKVFPAIRVGPWARALTLVPNSGRLAVAYKKIV